MTWNLGERTVSHLLDLARSADQSTGSRSRTESTPRELALGGAPGLTDGPPPRVIASASWHGSPAAAGLRSECARVTVSLEPLRESSALSNRTSDSTTAEVCVTVGHGLRKAVLRCSGEARSPRHTGSRYVVTASAGGDVRPAVAGSASFAIDGGVSCGRAT
jgi:hypothetical protein